jgi:DNA-binding MarR family transcriptional regulator
LKAVPDGPVRLRGLGRDRNFGWPWFRGWQWLDESREKILLPPLTFTMRFRIIRRRMNTHHDPRLVPAIERATHAVALWIERTFPEWRLSQAEAHVLAYLARHAPCSINELHQSLGHKRSTLTSLLDRLEARGWLRRGAHPTSRRLVMVHLTEAGQPAAERVHDALRDVEDRVRARARDEDTATCLRVLQALEEEFSHEPR